MKRTCSMLKLLCWLIAASLIVTFMEAPLVFAVTVTESTRTVQSSNFIVKWSSADQEAILSVQWHPGGYPDAAQNLTATYNIGECPAPFAPEYWGNSIAGGAPQDGDEVLVGFGTITPPAKTAWAPTLDAEGIEVHSQSTDCFAPSVAAQVPVRTQYRFSDDDPWANVISVDREFDFEEQPFSSAFRPYIPRLSRSSGRSFNEVKYPTEGSTLAAVSVDLCPFGCTRPDWDSAQGWFAIHSSTTGKGVIVKRTPNGITSQLWIDWDAASFTNASSFLLLPPPEGFTDRVVERMALCFYDSTIWPLADQQALKLPVGCGERFPSTAPSTHLVSFLASDVSGHVALAWETASEVALSGFHLYRTPAAGGAAVRVNESLIPATGNAATGGSYQLTDQPGRGHHVYQLVSVEAGGEEVLRAQAEAEVTAEERHLFVPMLQR